MYSATGSVVCAMGFARQCAVTWCVGLTAVLGFEGLHDSTRPCLLALISLPYLVPPPPPSPPPPPAPPPGADAPETSP